MDQTDKNGRREDKPAPAPHPDASSIAEMAQSLEAVHRRLDAHEASIKALHGQDRHKQPVTSPLTRE